MSSATKVGAASINSLAELENFFCCADSIINLEFPSCIRPPQINIAEVRDESYYFEYQSRENFKALMNYVYNVVNENFSALPWSSSYLCYIGNSGSGKSYNLAALVCLLRSRKANGWEFNKNVVYISSCHLFFNNADVNGQYILGNGKSILCEAFPQDVNEISKLNSWSDIVSFTLSKPSRSIIFIIDDLNYIISEEGNNDKLFYKRMLIELVDRRFCVFGITARRDALFNILHPDRSFFFGNTLYLYGGLTKNEWETWKITSRLPFYRELSKDDELKIIFLTGLVPQSLSLIEKFYKKYPNDDNALSKAFQTFENELAPAIFNELAASSNDLIASSNGFIAPSRGARSYVARMAYAIVDTHASCLSSMTPFDHRYFYRDSSGVLRAVSGLVRRAMRTYLEIVYDDDYYVFLTSKWILSVLETNNPIVKDFAFELYALQQIAKYPSKFIDVPLASCDIVRFSGDTPLRMTLNRKGLTIFIPLKYNRKYVDAVLRYVHPSCHKSRKRKKSNQNEDEQVKVEIYAVQITLQSFQSRKESLDFFKKGGDYASYEFDDEQVDRCMLWVSAQLPGIDPAQLPGIDPAIPEPEADLSKRVPFQQNFKLIELY